MAHQPGAHEEPGRFLTEPLYVEGLAAGEMLQPARELRRTLETVGTHSEWAALDQRGPARWTCFGHAEPRPPRAVRFVDPLDHLRYHVAGPLDPYPVAFADVLARDLFPIVQCRAGHGHAAKLDRMHECHGRHYAGPPHARHDLEHASDLSPGRKLVRIRPSGVVGCGAEPPARGELVELDHHTVDLEIEVVAPLQQGTVVGEHLVDGVGRLYQCCYRQTPRPDGVQRIRLAGKLEPAHIQHVVDIDVERTRCRHSRVELAQCSRRGVAGVGERFLPLVHEPLVELLEVA